MQSQSILSRDAKSYNALVFLGLAHARLEQFDKAEKAYDDACLLSPENGLAWQGLIDLYEKNGDRFLDLAKKLSAAYRRRLALPDLEATKRYDMNLKLAESIARTEPRESAAILQSALSLKEQTMDEARPVHTRVLELLCQHEDACIARCKVRDLGCTTRQVCGEVLDFFFFFI
jgi:tetratricopeptide (TPR) repeat protein